MQSSNTSNLVFNVPFLIAYISARVTLEPGDVITTGTPHGVGTFYNPPIFMKEGDVIEIEIEKIGILKNTVKAEK
jgi:acylpyruvate hydrolase